MKKITKIICILLIIIPAFIKAKTVNYEKAIKEANAYIENANFVQKSKYLVMNNIPFEYNGIVSLNTSFKRGGLLNKYEYDLSLIEGKSYLSPGVEFWLMTSEDESNQYYVENSVKVKSKDSSSGVRVTEFVLPDTKVKGKGTYNNPWEFVKTNLVQIKTNSVQYGYVGKNDTDILDGISENLSSDQSSYEFRIKPNTGYSIKETQGCNPVNISGNRYKIENIKNDITCLIVFDVKTFRYSLNGTYTSDPSPKTLYLKYKKGWYRDENTVTSINKITPPLRSGYSFKGFYTGENGSGTKVIDENGNILSGTTAIIQNNNDEQNLYAYFIACGPGKYLSGNTCTSCAAGSYSTGEANSSCTGCGAGTYSASAGSTSCTNCAVGSYSSGSANTKCTACTGKTTSATGQSSCNTNCSNASNVATWNSGAWNNNRPTNICSIATCASGYSLSSGSCELNKATVRINGALGETITWTEGGTERKVTLDDTGKKTGVTIAPGTYTFKAGTAFMSDFKTKYSKQVKVTTSTTVVNVYPDGAIYWFGNGSVANSSLASKCGGAMYSWTDVGDGGSGTFTSITSKSWVGNDKNSMWARMSSSGGYYTALIRCSATYKKGSYTRLKALMKQTGSTFDNVTTFLATNYSYTDGNDETGFSGNKYLNLDISSVSSSYGMHLYGHVRTKGGGEGSVRIYAIWLS